MKIPYWFKKKITFTFAADAAGAALTQTKAIPIMGEILHITQIVGNFGNVETAQLIIGDSDDTTIWDGTAKAKNATYRSEFGATTRKILTGDQTISCVLSGAPGANGTVTVVFYCYGTLHE